MKNSLALMPLVLLAACGIPGDTLLTDLTADDKWQKVCEHAVDEEAEPRVIDCGDPIGEITIEPSTVADCVDAGKNYTNEGCTGTLDDWAECADFEPTDDEICTGTIEYPAGCTAVATCVAAATTP